MKKLTGNQIRSMWLEFFKSKGHEIIPSASLIPHNDPTLLWINAGVAPLKKYFDGREKPKNPRMTNAQKSIRTNDIENVGKTARHHTFFEMLGNFSIGDYFRNEVLTWAYELLFSPDWFALDKNNIYITYYPEDKDTFEKWQSLGVEACHLVPIADNFWEIGEGPCGPDTEIFYDRGTKYDPNNIGLDLLRKDIENDRYIEIWNIVFSQYNSVSGLPREQYPELPSKNIDTGSGLERLACIFQETETNYETDLFMPMIKFLEQHTGCSYDNPAYKMAFRVIVDHVRSVTFAIADGATFANEGRGYVLRRILRRAVRYGKKLGIKQPFLYQMVSIVIDNMKDFYSYLVDKQAIIEKIIKTEEENFLKTLATGEKKLNDIMSNSKEKVISGASAFLLYDTFGFPIELTQEAASDNGFTVDIVGFNEELEKQKNRARNARSNEQSMNIQNEEYLNFKRKSEFVGYTTLEQESTVIGLFKDGKKVNKANGLLFVVLEKTPFYAEMGGQAGDQGIFTYKGQNFDVLDTFKLPNGQHAHSVDFKNQEISDDDIVLACVNADYRLAVSQNHSATHLLNQALREVLGQHVVQYGSQVTKENLRFDFNHYQNLTVEEILKVEEIVLDAIKKGYEVKTIETSLENAKKLGAQALFGEKYGDVVRLVDMTFSKELCGGTHVKNTSDIKNFAITSIESKGSGIFRIEAVASDNIFDAIQNAVKNTKDVILDVINKCNDLVKTAEKENIKLTKPNFVLPSIVGSYQDIINYRECCNNAKKIQKELEKSYDSQKRNMESADYKVFEKNAYVINSTTVIIQQVENIDPKALKDIVDKIALDYQSSILFFADVIDNSRINFIAKAVGNNVNCGQLVKVAAVATGGNGGGRNDFAQAGGKEVNKLVEALKLVEEKIKCDI